MNRKMLKIVLVSAIVAGCAFRLLDFAERSLEYDELWMMRHYFECSFAEIFTALETPNNHPLYTLCAQKICRIFGEDIWALRLTALLFGVALLGTAVWAAMKNFHSKYAKTALVVLIAFSPYPVHYSNTARGYSMQAFFVFALMLLLFSYAKKPSIGKALGVFFTAAAALFTIYSGLIFVCAAGGAYMLSFFKWKDWKNELKKNLFLFAAGADFCIVAALWLGLNWEKIAKAQQFGTQITSVMQFFRSAGHLIYDLNLTLPLIIILLAFILRPKDRVLRFGLSFSLLTFISILATKCGPARVYVPMIAVVLFCAARAIEVLGAKFRKIRCIELVLCLMICAPCVFLQTEIERISPPDWSYFVSQLEKTLPEECYVIYPAGDTYPIYCNYNKAAMNLAQKSERNLTMIGFVSPEKQKISCLTGKNAEKTLALGAPLEFYSLSNNYSISLYALAPLTAANYRKGEPIIAFFVFMPKRQYFAVRRRLYANDECYLLNGFFNNDYTDNSGGEAARAIPFFIPEASQDFKYYAGLSSSRLKFYILKSADK